MNNLPNGDEEISLIKFLAKYQYLKTSDVPYFFNSKKYYRRRITTLIEKKIIKRSNSTLTLASQGKQYIKKVLNLDYNKLNRNPTYVQRLLYISNLAAYYQNNSTVTFIPSFDLKDREILTITSRRYIGILDINGIKYLTYHISKLHDNKYIASVIFDIQKEKEFKNFIVLVDDSSMIKLLDFTFGYNQVLIINDTEENREKLKYLNSVNWPYIIKKEYKEPYISTYNFCEYMDKRNEYITYFYFIDTEKINRILMFLGENKNKHIDIICNRQLKTILQQLIPRAKYNVLDIEKFINRKRNIYYE